MDSMSTAILTPTLATARTRAVVTELRQVAATFGPATVVTVDELDLNEVADALAGHRYLAGAVDASIARTVQARVVVVVTPIRHDSLAGLIKLFLDLLPRDALHGCASFGVALSGSARLSGNLTYALNPVLTALGTARLLRPVHVLPSDWCWADDGPSLLEPTRAKLAERLRTAHDREGASPDLQEAHA